jgi:RHS repeat-associated protein
MHQWIRRVCVPSAFAGAMLVSAGVHATAAGTTAGSFAVTPVGAAAYAIPIWAPPGPDRLQPNIALTYNSGQDNGYLGVGWSLSGLSSISRCNRTVAQDGTASAVTLATTDALCLDGQRLQLTGGTQDTSGSTYQTEIATFQNVTAYGSAGNGPAYFIVQAPNGVKYEYGNTTSSQVLATGSSTALSWFLDKVTDPAGNTMTISYNAATGTAVPATISWTPTSAGATSYAYTMTFSYGTNVPQSSIYGYVAGTTVINTQLLNSIAIAYVGTTVKQYNLTYTNSPATGRKELTQVQECADSTQNNCLAPTAIGYQSSVGAAGIAAATTSAGSSTHAVYTRTADVNGDGLQDIVYATLSGSTLTWWVQFATASGFSAPVNTGATTNAALFTAQPLIDDFLGTGANELLAPVGTTWYAYQWNGASFTATSTGLSVDTSASGISAFATADINGDGRADLAVLELTSGNYYVVTRLNTSSGSTVSFSSTTTSTSTGVASSNSLDMGLYGDNQIANTPIRHFDWNGNGLQGFLLNYGLIVNEGKLGNKDFFYTKALASNGSGGFTTSSSWVSGNQAYSIPTPIKWNDDACTDLYYQGSILVSACNGATQSTIVIYSAATGQESVVAVDWAGHGRRDILANFGGGTTLTDYASTGTGVAGGVATSLSATAYIVFDQNGDGLDDLLTANAGSSGLLYGLHNDSGLPADLANSFTDGYGVNASPTYVSIARSNYTETNTAVYPDSNYIGPYYVVSQYSATSPASAGGTYTKSYTYTGAHVNLEGRGFMGFTTQQVVDSRTSVAETFTFNLTFPTTGLVIGDVTVQSGGAGATIFNRTSTPAATTLNSASGAQRYFPYIASQVANTYEVGGAENGQLITTTATSYTFDSFGNSTQVSNTVTDTDSGSPDNGQSWTKTVTNTFDIDGPDQSADLAAWCLVMPTAGASPSGSVVTYSSSLSGSTTVTRTKSFAIDTPSNCRVTQVVTEPGSSLYKVTEAFGFDSFGNINSDAVTGVGMPTRTTTANWGTTGQFPVSVTDPTGPTTGTTQFNYNFNYGKLSSITDPNLLTTSWLYADGFGRQTNETRPDGTYTNYHYYDTAAYGYGFHGLITDAVVFAHNGSQISGHDTVFNPFRQRLAQVDQNLSGGYSQSQVSYDSLGRVSQQYFPCAFVSWPTNCTYYSTTSYDVLGRVTQVQRPISASNSSLQTTGYAYAGRSTTVTDANGHPRILVSNVNGWLRRTQDATGYSINLGYDAAGSKTSATDSLGNALWSGSYLYGVAPFLVSSTDTDLGAWSYTYDALGERTGWTDAKGQPFSAQYDSLSRMTTRSEPDLFSSWTWGTSAAAHEIGQLHSVCTGTGTNPTTCNSSGYSESETYDSDARPASRSITIPADGTYTYGYSYNSTTGLLDTLTYPTVNPTGSLPYALQVKYAYQGGVLQSLTDISDSPNVTLWTANAENPRGQPTQETFGNGVVVNHNFDAVTGWPSAVTAGVGGGATLQNNSYLFDYVGNLTQRQDNNAGTTENVYPDVLNRLDHTVGDSNFTRTYDAMGRIASWSAFSNTTNYDDYSTPQSGCSYYANVEIHALRKNTQGPWTTSACYDANGNMLSALPGTTFTWTSYNQVSTGSWAGGSSQFFYDQNHQRWKQLAVISGVSENTTYIGGLLEEMTNSSGTAYRHYVSAGNNSIVYTRMSTGSNPTYYMTTDNLGSTAVITDQTGALVVAERFAAFGYNEDTTTQKATIATVSRHEFTGQEDLPSLYLTNMNGRIYNGATFLSPDPNIPDPTNTQDYDRYSYVDNNPLTLIDPTGFDKNTVCNSDRGCPGSGSVQGMPEQGGWSCYGNCSGANWANAFTTTVPGSSQGGSGGGGSGGGAAGGTATGGQSALGSALSNIPLLGNILGGLGDLISGVANTGLGLLSFGQSGTLNVGLGQIGNGLGEVASGLANLAGEVWTSPNTVVGVLIGLASLGFGGQYAGIHNNAMQFTNVPWGSGGALTIGNVQLYNNDTPGTLQPGYDGLGPLEPTGLHEEGHTYQYQLLGPFFAPLYFLSGGLASASNPFEQAADYYSRGGSWWPWQ